VAAVGQAPPPAGPAPQPKRRTSPILRETGWDGKLPPGRAHVAVVVVYHRGDHQVIWPHERTRVQLHRRPATTYEVDLGLYRAVITAELPSQGHGASFQARINVQWRVLDPSVFVRHQVLDIDETLAESLLHQARGIARECSIEQITAAEDKINDKLRGVEIDVTAPSGIQQAMRDATKRGCIGAEYGLWTHAITQLTLDEAAAEHRTKMLKLKWAIEEEKAEQELRKIQDTNQQEITKARIEVYRGIIAKGDVEQFALRLAGNPDDISAITAIIREDQLTSRRDTIEFISRMVDSGVVERWEVSDHVREALEWLRDATARVVTDKSRRDAEIEPGPHQRRHGRGKPIEQSPASQPPPDVIVVTAEAVPLKQTTQPETSSEPTAMEAEPTPKTLPE
jgi:hypothetical protein